MTSKRRSRTLPQISFLLAEARCSDYQDLPCTVFVSRVEFDGTIFQPLGRPFTPKPLGRM